MKSHINWICCYFIMSAAMLAIGAERQANVPTDEASKAVYPREKSVMDELAGNEVVNQFVRSMRVDGVVFSDDREHSVRWTKSLPSRWLAEPGKHLGVFKGSTQPGEFYVFQLAAFAAKREFNNIQVNFSDLSGPNGIIPSRNMRCFNLGGVDPFGKTFIKKVSVPKGNVQPLWVGVDLPKDAKGVYQGCITVSDSCGFAYPVEVELKVGGAVLDDHGDNDSWRLSRLRWLDSTIGLDDDVVTRPYLPIARNGQLFRILGREMQLADNGFPCQLASFFNNSNTAVVPTPTIQLLASPFRFVVETGKGEIKFGSAKIEFVREQKGAVEWRAVSRGDGVQLIVSGLLEYDGFTEFHCAVKADHPVPIKDIRLEFAVAKDASTYFAGLGQPSGRRETKCIDWKWDPQFHRDGFWMGAVNGGLGLQLIGRNYRRPLINCYYRFRPLNIPESWGGADGKSGGIRISPAADGAVRVIAYSGPRELKANEQLDYGFRLSLTPFKTLNTEEQWSVRYLHKGQGVVSGNGPIDSAKTAGANVINIHHNNDQTPIINYPYFDPSMPLLRKFVSYAHTNGVKVKIYYTTRELTTHIPEFYALWSLNGEIIVSSPGKDGIKAGGWNYSGAKPHPWLVAHLGNTGYISAWSEVIGGRYKGLLDLAVLTMPESRMDNFYLGGLKFLLESTDIDGMYLDDTALGRKSLQRAHRIFEAHGKPLLMDLHSWNEWHRTAGATPSIYVFLQHLPYFHRLWFGEDFDYNTPPDYWLVEVSGIPFGLMGEMMGGGNPWRGMLFGMTGRLGWGGDPQPMWKLWDDFGMNGTEMFGFWDPACPVKTGLNDVRATVYRKQGKSLIAIASWAPVPTKVKLAIDWKTLGLDPKKTTLRAPAIERFQPEATYTVNDAIPVQPGRGWLLIAEENPLETMGNPISQ